MSAELPTTPPSPVQTKATAIGPGLTLLSPLTRRGRGPGLLLLASDQNATLDIRDGVPSSLVKWAEEGYSVVAIGASAVKTEKANIAQVLDDSIKALEDCSECEPRGTYGLVAYDPEAFNLVLPHLAHYTSIDATVVYRDASSLISSSVNIPILHHVAAEKPSATQPNVGVTLYYYPNTTSHLFATSFQPQFSYTNEAVSHTRNLTFLKKIMGAPYFDLESIWDEHTYYEFADRSVEHTMSTMVAEPYVNHIPTLTGGIGRASLTDFYRRHFIFNNSADTSLELISRTVGIDRIVDEFVFSFTHDQEVDWIFPGIPPTHKKVQLPFVAIVNVRGDRLYHEHISWDQGGALKQIGLLPEYLPFPFELPDSRRPEEGKAFYYRLPVSGAEAAEKMRDRASVDSNKMFEYKTVEK